VAAKRFVCPQPFALLAWKEGTSIPKLAHELKVDGPYLKKVASGWYAATDELRDKLVKHFELPIEMLLCAKSLATQYNAQNATRTAR
jgi:hypothetical protein